jgi:transposase-like protein
MARKSYNDEFKIAAAMLVCRQGYSVRKAAKCLGVDEGSIRDWVREFAPEVIASNPDASPDELRRAVTRLHEENRRLLVEREILRKTYATREEARWSLFEYIEVFYNRQRLPSTLGYRSPAQYEVRFAS